jgi:hypothetical protein
MVTGLEPCLSAGRRIAARLLGSLATGGGGRMRAPPKVRLADGRTSPELVEVTVLDAVGLGWATHS